MAQDEVETLEAALNFISQYELSCSDAQSRATDDAIDLTHEFAHSHNLSKSHSLEIPEHHEALEPFDPDLHAAEAFLNDLKAENELFEAPQTAPRGVMQGLLNMAVRPTLSPTPSRSVDSEAASAASPSVKSQRRRQSKRDEINDLRDTVAELSQQLDQLQTSSTPNSPAEEEARVRSILSQPQSLWQQVATRQLLLREKAEDVNAQLRSLVETRARQTKNLKRMLSRRNDTETLELIGMKRRKKMHVTGPPPKDNEEVFAKLLQGTDELYVGLDKLFADKGMAQVPCPGRKRQVQRDAVNGSIVMFLDRNQVPFELYKTQRAIWKLLAGRHRKETPYSEGTIDWESQEKGNTLSNYVAFNCVAGDASALLQVREVARKYITEDRATFICRSVMEPTRTGEKVSMGLKFQETMTIVARPGEPLSSGQETTIIESYLCATRHDEDTALARKFRGEVYVDIAIEGWEQSYSSNNQDIENLLFDEAIQFG
ncbi:hypothetical protein KRP22_014538 [Phytophthora ramorum]|nr:hypothetical protein KRP22_8859 [Phytophthora ramorum]